VLKPKHDETHESQTQVRSLKQAVSSLEATLISMPPIPEEERRLWQAIEQRLEATLFTEEELMSGLAQLADSVEDAGGELATVTVEKAKLKEQEKTPRTTGRRPRPRTSENRNNEPRVRSSPPESPLAAASNRPESTNSPTTSALTARSRTARTAGSSQAAKTPPVYVGMRIGRIQTIDYPAMLEVKGEYASWPLLLSSVSREFVPVLIHKIEGRPQLEGTQMALSMTVPVLKARRAGGGSCRRA